MPPHRPPQLPRSLVQSGSQKANIYRCGRWVGRVGQTARPDERLVFRHMDLGQLPTHLTELSMTRSPAACSGEGCAAAEPSYLAPSGPATFEAQTTLAGTAEPSPCPAPYVIPLTAIGAGVSDASTTGMGPSIAPPVGVLNAPA